MKVFLIALVMSISLVIFRNWLVKNPEPHLKDDKIIMIKKVPFVKNKCSCENPIININWNGCEKCGNELNKNK